MAYRPDLSDKPYLPDKSGLSNSSNYEKANYFLLLFLFSFGLESF